jgi:Flp pilus assembly protein TadD
VAAERGFMRLALALCASSALASPESDALKRQGMQSLEAQKFQEAAEHFREAARADPRDAEAAFLQGAAANRLGQFSAAESLLRAAETAGYRSAELHFELGWTAMGSGRAQLCVERLERFEAASPGRGQTSEFLGRCYLALRQFDKAESMFARALERDPRLAPTVKLSMAVLEQARGKPEAARTHLEAVESADAPTGRALRDLAGPPDPPTQPDKPLRLSASLSAGHNDNVIGLGNTIPLPTDISRKGANYARIALGAAYTHQLASRTSATVGYALLFDRYDGLSASNLNDHYLYADVFHQMTNRAAFSLRASGEYTELGGAHFRNALALRPALSYRFGANAVTEIAYAFTDSDYIAPTAAVFNRDGATHGLSALHSFRLPGTGWGGAAGANIGRNNTEGSDFQSDSLGASATLRYTFANRIVAALGLSATWDDYRNPNSLAGSGFSFAREDRQQVLSAQFTGPLADRFRWFVQAQDLRNHSNIAFYDYKQQVYSAGLAADF